MYSISIMKMLLRAVNLNEYCKDIILNFNGEELYLVFLHDKGVI